MEWDAILLQVLTGGVIIPPIIELVTHKIKGLPKVIIMAGVANACAIGIMYFEGGFIHVIWTDPVSVLGIAGALLTLMSLTWNQLWRKGINPFYDRFIKRN